MKVEVKYTGTDYNTGLIKKYVVVHELDIHDSNVEDIDNEIERINKIDLMYEHELASIADWEIISVDGVSIENPEGFNELERMVNILIHHKSSKKTIMDFTACYYKLQSTLSKEDLTIFDKILIVLEAVDIAYSSSLNTLQELKDERLYIESLDLEQMIEYKKKWNLTE